MKIGILPDVHFGYGDETIVRRTLRTTIDRFNDDIMPDHVIVLGDLIEDQPDPQRDRHNYQEAVNTLGELSAPVTYVLGNHDVVNLSLDELESIMGQPAYGRIDKTPLLYLDSSAPRLADPRGEISSEQMEYLDETLDTLDWALLFVHHPIHYHDIRDNEWFGEQPERAFCGNKADIQTVLDRHSTTISVVSAHLHETDYTRYRGIDHFSINAFNKTRPDGGLSGTYGVLTVTDTLSFRVTDTDRVTWTLELPLQS